MAAEAAWGVRDVARVAWAAARRELVLASGAVLLTSATNLALPRLIGWLVDLSARGAGAREARHALAVSLGVFALGACGSLGRVFVLEVGAAKITRALRERVLSAALLDESLPAAMSAEDASSGAARSSSAAPPPPPSPIASGSMGAASRDARARALAQCLSRDADELGKAIFKHASNWYRGLNSAVGGSFMLLSLSPSLTLVSLALLPLVGVGAMGASRMSKRAAAAARAATDAVTEDAALRLQAADTVRLCGNEQHEVERFSRQLAALQGGAARRAALAEGLFIGGLSLAANSTLALVVAAGGYLVNRGALSAGQLTGFAMYSGMVGLGCSQLTATLSDLRKSLDASASLQRVVGQAGALGPGPASAQDAARATDAVPALVGPALVQLEQVRLELAGLVVLDGLSLTLRPGRITALAGRSGAGKSSVARLLCLLERPLEGRMLWNGADASALPARAVRDRVAACLDSALLTGLSIRDNIAYGRRSASEHEIVAAAQQAGLHEWVRSLPAGYDTVLGSASQAELSSGQRQRLCVARCLLRAGQASLVVCDEVSSNLDGRSERAILIALRQLADAGRTVLLVAHGRRALAAADEVLVLERGHVVESGKLEDLLVKGGRLSYVLAADRGEERELQDEP
jgi:ABC-type multidrug transport system fused ATPase/permease subunit